MKFIVFYIIILFNLFSNVTIGQEYFNKHYKIGTSNVTPVNLIIWQDQTVASFLNFNDQGESQSGLTFINPIENDLSIHLFENIRIGLDGIFEIRDTLHFFGKRTEIDNNLIAFGFDLINKDYTYIKEYSSFLDSSFPFAGTEYKNNIYRSYSDNVNGELIRELGIMKLNLKGEKQWQYNYSTHFQQNTNAGIEVIRGCDLIVTSKIQNNFNDVAQTLRINEEGIVIDSVLSAEQILDFTSRVYMAVIDSQIIVNAYEIEGEWDKQPFRLDFYNEDLELLNYTLLPSTESMRISPFRLHNGGGKYFFMIGSFIDFNGDLSYGYIVKIGIDGDIIWEHYYRNPDFLGEDVFNTIIDIHELENGDIYCLGSISPPGLQKELWLFKIAENGCYGTDTCGQEVLLTSTNHIQHSSIEVYPNPTSNLLNFKGMDNIIKLNILDMHGKILYTTENKISSETLDVNFLPNGVYSIVLFDKKGVSFSTTFVKI
ncbi:MAG: T9SS type A sorting domain-containing protein [Saprospiraceae bacterium]|nr:T9SS type A sorting domain-containing protein [Saprospiraceae bacterium]